MQHMEGINLLDGKQLLIRLTETAGGSGDEARVTRVLEEATHALVNESTTDSVGNLTLLVKGEGESTHPRVMIAAHTDEITLMVSKIEKGGFLRVAQVGGFDPRTLLGQEVVVHGRDSLIGIIGSKPPHLSTLEERQKSIPLHELFIDLGMSEEHVLEVVTVGDRITMHRNTMQLLGDRMSGKAMDNRASVTAMAICLDELSKLRHTADVFAVGTMQEEIGSKGAQTAAFGLMPDIAIAIDVCHGETPGVTSDLAKKLGAGPVLTLGPRIHPKLFTALKEVAQSENIPLQIEVSQGPTWTDADPMQIVQVGIPTALLSIPLRYMHTSVETLDFEDVRLTGVLLARFIAKIDAAFVEGLTCYLND